MNQQNRERFSPKNNEQTENKSNTQFRRKNQFRLINFGKFGYFTTTVMLLALSIKIVSPAKLALSQSIISDSIEKQTSKTLILAQEEGERESREEPTEAEGESEGEPTEAEGESREEPAEAEGESEGERESEGEPAEAEGESERERESEGEGESEEEGESGEELSFEEEKKELEENIDEHYEEWESRKTSVQISHSFSAITTIVLTIVIL